MHGENDERYKGQNTRSVHATPLSRFPTSHSQRLLTVHSSPIALKSYRYFPTLSVSFCFSLCFNGDSSLVMTFSRPCGVLTLLAISWFIFNAVAAGINIPSTLDGPFKPVTVPFDSSLRGGTLDLPDSDPRVQRRVKGFEPEQISVSLSAHYDSVWISWITGSLPFL